MLLRPYAKTKCPGEKVVRLLIVTAFFVVYLHLAIGLPMDQAPDEAMRFDLAKWIYTHMALPVGNEEEIVSPVWGFSYAYNLYLPELYHYESKSRGYEDTPEKKQRFEGEVRRFQERWKKELAAGDPYYNPNLTLDTEDFSIKR